MNILVKSEYSELTENVLVDMIARKGNKIAKKEK
jgi:hypothetical protein